MKVSVGISSFACTLGLYSNICSAQTAAKSTEAFAIGKR